MHLVPVERSWRRAWEDSLTGPASFYANNHPAQHFTTDVMQGAIAPIVLPRVRELLAARDGIVTVLDAGAGGGDLLTGLLGSLSEAEQSRVHLLGLDLRDRPAGLDDRIGWESADIRQHELAPVDGIIVAHELLDDIPCDWVEADADGQPRIVLVADDGSTHLGPGLDDVHGCRRVGVDAASLGAWLKRWWPTGRAFARCEPGIARDALWARLTNHVNSGYALAFDYGHLLPTRLRGDWDAGTIVGYRAGHVVSPALYGTCNITAHVAIDAVAAAAGDARHTSITRRHGDFHQLVQAFA